MTLTTRSTLGPRTMKWDQFTGTNVISIRANVVTGLTASFSTSGYTVPKGMVLLIDRISINGRVESTTGDAVHRVEMTVDGGTDIMSWSFPHVTGTPRENKMVWRPNGAAVLFEDAQIEARVSSTDLQAWINVFGRLMSKWEALDTGLINGTEFFKGGGSLTNSSENELVAPITGLTPEITAFSCFGHHDAATVETVSMKFSPDGSASLKTIFEAGVERLSTEPQPETMIDVVVDECRIQGPVSNGIYVNPDGAAGLDDDVRFAVCGRYVDRNTCYQPTGERQTGQSTDRSGSDNFWFWVDNTVIGGAGADGDYELFARDATNAKSIYTARLNGYAYTTEMSDTLTGWGFSTTTEAASPAAASYIYKLHNGITGYTSGAETGLSLPVEVGATNLAISIPANLGVTDGGILCWGTLNHFDLPTTYSASTYKSF